jgi:hypothetical protein
VSLPSGAPLFLERHAHPIGVNRAEFFRAPGLGLQWAVRMHLASASLVFSIHRLNTLDSEADHGLVADFAGECFVVHPGDVQVSIAAVDPCIGWRSAVAKRLLETANFRPPIQRLSGVSRRQNGDSAFDDRFHAPKYKTNSSGLPKLDGLSKSRQYFFFVLFESVFFLAAHEIHIKLRHSHAGQLAQFFPMRLGRSNQTKSIHNVIRNEVRVAALHFTMMLVIVPTSIAHKRVNAGGNSSGL